MTRPVKDLSKSVHVRLLALAKASKRPFAELLQLFAMERFLYRLAMSQHASKFVLKGGLMLRVWKAPLTRPTKDADLLGRTSNTPENLESIVRAVCAVTVPADGLRFDESTVVATPIKKDAEYQGVRVKFNGLLGVARVPMQVDVGFGDSVFPAPTEVELPALLEFPPPRLLAYQRETTIAEKFHAMVVLGSANTRMKDFYDLWLLASTFSFDCTVLVKAISSTFSVRNTVIEAPVFLESEFAKGDGPQRSWSAFLRKSALSGAPAEFGSVALVLREFLLPLVKGRQAGTWSPGGPWK